MRRMSRGKNVEAVVASNYKSHSEGRRQLDGRKPSHDGQRAPSIPRSRNSVELHLEQRKLSDYHFVTDGWIDSLPTPNYVPIPQPGTNGSVLDQSYLDDRTPHHSLRTPRESPPPLRSDSPARTLPIRTRKSSISSTSTLFERSSAVPITIIVTTPVEDRIIEAEDAPAGSFPGPPIRKPRHGSTMSLPALNSQFVPDKTRLMPPIDPQLDMRRMRKAREFEDIRHFLIGFLNTKGTQLPKTLRTRIMSIYGITDGDLDPKVVAKFVSGAEGVELDEGVVLDLGLQGTTPTNRDHMRILDLAFQSVLPAAAPMASQDILAARRKRMSMPLSGMIATRATSLHSVDEYSPLASKMSLATNFRSKQTLDSIISNRALLQSTRKPPNIAASVSGAAVASSTQQSQSFFGRRKSLSVKSSSRPPSISSGSVKRPQSLYRFLTDTSPTPKSVTPSPIAPPPAFTHPNLKSRHMRSEPSSVIQPSLHKPAISSKLSLPSLNIPQPEQATFEAQHPATSSHGSTSPKISSTETKNEKKEGETPTDSLKLRQSNSWIVPLITSHVEPISTPPPKRISPPPQAHAKTSKPIPKPIAITQRKDDDLVILAPTPISPAHRLTHKTLTRSEVSDLEKPFYIRRRRSSSTLSPNSPIFVPQSPTIGGYDSDSSDIVFPVHPGFAPLGREQCHASMKVEERRISMATGKEKWGNNVTISVVERSSPVGKLKKEKKEKRSSMFGSLKRSLFGR